MYYAASVLSQEALGAHFEKIASISWTFGADELLHAYDAKSKEGDPFKYHQPIIMDKLYANIRTLFIDDTNTDLEWLKESFNLTVTSIQHLTINFPIGEAIDPKHGDNLLNGYIELLNSIIEMPNLEYLKLRNLKIRIDIKAQLPQLAYLVLADSAIPKTLVPNNKLKISKDDWDSDEQIKEFVDLAVGLPLHHQAYENLPNNYNADPDDLHCSGSVLMQNKNGDFKYIDKISKRLGSNDWDWIKGQIMAANKMGEQLAYFDQLMIDASRIGEKGSEIDAVLKTVSSPRLFKIITTDKECYQNLLRATAAAKEETDSDITLESDKKSSISSKTYVSRPNKLLDTDNLGLNVFEKSGWTHVKIDLMSVNAEESPRSIDELIGFQDARYMVIKGKHLLKSFITESIKVFKNESSKFPHLEGAMAVNKEITIAMSRKSEYIEIVFHSLESLKENLALIPKDQCHYRINFNWPTDYIDFHDNDWQDLTDFIGQLENAESVDFTGKIRPFFQYMSRYYVSIERNGRFVRMNNLDHIRIETDEWFDEINAADLIPAPTILLNSVDNKVILIREVEEMVSTFMQRDPSTHWNIVEQYVFTSSFMLSKKSTAPYSFADENSRLLVDELEKMFSEPKIVFNFSGETSPPNQGGADNLAIADLK